MSFAGSVRARPPRVFFTNIRTGETNEMPFTPTTLTETIVVNYARQAVTGMSHETMQYGNTQNYKIEGLEFFVSGMPQGPSPRNPARAIADRRNFQPSETDTIEADRAMDLRNFLMSLCYSSETAETVRDGAPPRILFVWPQFMALTCVFSELRITHEKFNQLGRPINYRAIINIEEIRDFRLTSEQVRTRGTQRTTLSSIPFERGANGATS